MSSDRAPKSTPEAGRPQKQLNPEDGPLPAMAQALRDIRAARTQGRPPRPLGRSHCVLQSTQDLELLSDHQGRTGLHRAE